MSPITRDRSDPLDRVPSKGEMMNNNNTLAHRQEAMCSPRLPDKPVVVVDMGASKITVMVARIGRNGRVLIDYIRSESCSAMKGTDLEDEGMAQATLLRAVQKVERSFGLSIRHIDMFSYKSIHHLEYPLDSSRDDLEFDSDYTFGSYRWAEQYALSQVSNITKTRPFICVVNALGIQIKDGFFSPIASGLGCTKRYEREEGVLVIDMGAELTDYCLFIGDKIRCTGSIPFGGNRLTDELSRSFGLSRSQAEKLKRLKGAAFLKKEYAQQKVFVLNGNNYTGISKADIVDPLSQQIKSLGDQIQKRISVSPHQLLDKISGIRITGGCARLLGIDQAFESVFGIPASVWHPTSRRVDPTFSEPAFSTNIGLLKAINL